MVTSVSIETSICVLCEPNVPSPADESGGTLYSCVCVCVCVLCVCASVRVLCVCVCVCVCMH